MPVDCQWSEWTITPCSASCGKGYREKIRSKTVEEKDGGVCSGENVEKAYCNHKECIGIYIVKKIDKIFIEHECKRYN